MVSIKGDIFRFYLKSFLASQRAELDKKREDFMTLEKEINASHEKKISGEEWYEILRRVLRSTNKLTEWELSLLPPIYTDFFNWMKRSSQRRSGNGAISFQSFNFSFRDFDDADDIIEPEVYREVMASYDEEFAIIDKIEELGVDRMLSLELRTDEYECLKKSVNYIREIDKEISLRKERNRCIFGMKWLDTLIIENYLTKHHWWAYDKSIKQLHQMKQESIESTFWVFKRKLLSIFRMASEKLEKLKEVRQKAKNSFRKAIRKLININRIFNNSVKEKQKKARSLLKKWAKNWKIKKTEREKRTQAAWKDYKTYILEEQNQEQEYFNSWQKHQKTKNEKRQSEQSQQYWQKQHQWEQEQQQNYEKVWEQEADRLAKEREEESKNREQNKNNSNPKSKTPPTATKGGMVVSPHHLFIKSLEELGVKINDRIRVLTMGPFKYRKNIRKFCNSVLQKDQQVIQQLKNEEYLKQIMEAKVEVR